MPITDMAARNAVAEGRIKKLSDGGGLQLFVFGTGSKSWNFAYRFGGKQRTLNLGPYPLLSLREAREARDDAKKLLLKGIDPAAARKAAKEAVVAATEHTFEKVAEELRAKKRREGISENTLGKIQWMHGMASASIGQRPVSEVKPPEVLKILQQVEARGTLETANRLRAVIGEVFRFAIATARAETDPTQALKGAIARPKVKNRAAMTDPADVGEMLRAIDAFRGQATTRAALQLMALLYLAQASYGLRSGRSSTWARPSGPSPPLARRCAGSTESPSPDKRSKSLRLCAPSAATALWFSQALG